MQYRIFPYFFLDLMSLAPHFPFTGLWEPGNFMGYVFTHGVTGIELNDSGTYWNNTWTSVVVRPNPMVVPEGSSQSTLESLRRGPVRASGAGLVDAICRVEQATRQGAGERGQLRQKYREGQEDQLSALAARGRSTIRRFRDCHPF